MKVTKFLELSMIFYRFFSEPMLESLAWGHNYEAYFTKTSPGLDRWRRENHDHSSEMNFTRFFIFYFKSEGLDLFIFFLPIYH